MSALLAGQPLPPPPAWVNWTAGMPPNLGAMLNDQLGDCTCAAWGHAVQVWTSHTGSMLTLPESDIEDLYEGACGYVPGQPKTDQGGIEQNVLSYLVNKGIAGHRLSAFVEVDPRNLDDVRRAIDWCGVAYIGFNVPGFLMNGLTTPNSDWDTQPGPDSIEGGHAVILAGYDSARFTVISWGNLYTMTTRFFSRYVDEVYALADSEWVGTRGLTPLGLTLAQLEAQMIGIKEAA